MPIYRKPKTEYGVVNVRDYGAKGDDSTDDWQAFTDAYAACPDGGTVKVPPGTYRIAQPLMLRRNRTLQGSHSPWWSYRAGSPCAIKPHANFAGTAVLHVADKEILGDAAENDGGRVEHLAVNGNSKVSGGTGANVVGLLFEGLVRDWYVTGVDISQSSGNAFMTKAYTRANATAYYPRGINFERVSAYSPGLSGSGNGHGFSFSNLTDCAVSHALAVSAEGTGFFINNPGELKLVNSRAVFCIGDGLHVFGAATVGGFTVSAFSTDRNGGHGVRINQTGTQPIQLDGLLCRRDGASATAGGLAAVAIVGTSSSDKASPVTITNLITTVGQSDEDTGNWSPQYAVRAENAQYVSIDGCSLWGIDQAIYDGASVTRLDIGNTSRRNGQTGTLDTTNAVQLPVATNLPNNGTSPPAPVLAASSTDRRGSFTFGAGTSPAVGGQVRITFARPYEKVPTVTAMPLNGSTASRQPFLGLVETTGFNFNLNTAPTAGTANTTYAASYTVTP